MGFGSILLLAVGLAMDAVAAAAARGAVAREIRPGQVLRVAVLFGGFQAGMPLVGWVAGAHAGPFLNGLDHWIGFGLLTLLGLHMLLEARTAGSRERGPAEDLFSDRALVLVAVATSIDALAAGVTLPILNAPLTLSVVTIGVVTGVLSAAGLFVGRRFGAAVGPRVDVLGGLILIALGCKLLAEHWDHV